LQCSIPILSAAAIGVGSQATLDRLPTVVVADDKPS